MFFALFHCDICLQIYWQPVTSELPHYIIMSLFMFGIKINMTINCKNIFFGEYCQNWVLNKTKLSTIILSKITLSEAIFFSSNTDNICKPFNHKSVYSILIYYYAGIIKHITLKYVELPFHLKGYQTRSPITWKRMIN